MAAKDPPPPSDLSGAWTIAWVAGILVFGFSGLLFAIRWVRRRLEGN